MQCSIGSKHGVNMSGLLTKCWGPVMWDSMDCIGFNFPIKPSLRDKQNYKAYYGHRGNMLPCVACQESYKKFISIGDTKLDDNVFENRNTLTRWLFRLHEVVNHKLDVDYDMTYEMFCHKYESYIATCQLSSEEKIKAYKEYYNHEAPYLSYEMALCFEEYAISRNLSDYREKLDATYLKYSNKQSY